MAETVKALSDKRDSKANPRKTRASGKNAYYATLEQALVAIVSAWEVFISKTVVYVLNRSPFVGRLALRHDEPLKRLVREFRLSEDIPLEFVTKGFDPSRLLLGAIVEEAHPGRQLRLPSP